MKYLYIGLLLTGLLIVGCFWSQRAVTARAEAVAAPLEGALEALRQGDAARARALAAEAAAEWGRHERLLASLVSHERSGGIREALEELKWLEGPALGRACERLLRQVRALGEAERPVFENIL